MITVGISGTFGIGGMVITEGSDGRRWWCSGGALGAGVAGPAGGFGAGARPVWLGGGAAVVLLVALELLVVLDVLDDELVVLDVLDELLAGLVLPPPGPRLVSWMMPQITRDSITAISPTQAISTGLRRNQGGGSCPTGSVGVSVGGCSNCWL